MPFSVSTVTRRSWRNKSRSRPDQCGSAQLNIRPKKTLSPSMEKKVNTLRPPAPLLSVHNPQRLTQLSRAARRCRWLTATNPGAPNRRMHFCHLCIKVKYGKSLNKVKESESACVSALWRTYKTKVVPRWGCNLAAALHPLLCVCVCVGPWLLNGSLTSIPALETSGWAFLRFFSALWADFCLEVCWGYLSFASLHKLFHWFDIRGDITETKISPTSELRFRL